MKSYSMKINGKITGKAYPLYMHIASKITSKPETKPVDVMIDLLNGDDSGHEGMLLSDLKLDDSEQLEKYSDKTESQLVTEMFIKNGIFDIEMVKKCMIAHAKADHGRRKTGRQWQDKEDRQAQIHEEVEARMAKNDVITEDRWYYRELINSKWISVNCATSMAKADEYIACHTIELENHNKTIRVVKGKDLGKYFNRSARAAIRKLAAKDTAAVAVETMPTVEKPVVTPKKLKAPKSKKSSFDQQFSSDMEGDVEVLGASGNAF